MIGIYQSLKRNNLLLSVMWIGMGKYRITIVDLLAQTSESKELNPSQVASILNGKCCDNSWYKIKGEM